MSHNSRRSWQLQTRAFVMPKEGFTSAECEDAIGINEAAKRYAVADGATEAFEARAWAAQLAGAWVDAASPALTIEAFQAWAAVEGARLHSSWSARKLSWYAEEKARDGSFAAFIGLQLYTASDSLQWTTIALGDACFVQRRGLRFAYRATPIDDYRRFNQTPLLVPSRVALQPATLAQATIATGAIEHDDVLLLMSDAVAAWYLKLADERDELLKEFDALLASAPDADLQNFLQTQRARNRLRDDDAALLRLAASLVA